MVPLRPSFEASLPRALQKLLLYMGPSHLHADIIYHISPVARLATYTQRQARYGDTIHTSYQELFLVYSAEITPYNRT